MKLKMFGAAALLALMCSFSSCKKDYTCTCTDSSGDKTNIELKNVTKSQAKSACDTYSLSGETCSL